MGGCKWSHHFSTLEGSAVAGMSIHSEASGANGIRTAIWLIVNRIIDGWLSPVNMNPKEDRDNTQVDKD